MGKIIIIYIGSILFEKYSLNGLLRQRCSREGRWWWNRKKERVGWRAYNFEKDVTNDNRLDSRFCFQHIQGGT